MSRLATTKSTHLFSGFSARSAALLTRRRRSADRLQTQPQTVWQTLLRQDAPKSGFLLARGVCGGLEKKGTQKAQKAPFRACACWCDWAQLLAGSVGFTAFSCLAGRSRSGRHGQNHWTTAPEQVDGITRISERRDQNVLERHKTMKKEPEWTG